MIIKIEDSKHIKKRVDSFIVEYFDNKYPRNKVGQFIEKQGILINNKNQKTSYKLKLNDTIDFNLEEFENFINPDTTLTPYEYKLDIIFEDDDVIVINKPKNMLSHPTKFDRKYTLTNALIHRCKENLSNIAGDDRLGIVHRLDKNTAGLIICAKNNEAHEILAQQIKEKIAKRKYLALALGEFEQKEGIINKPLIHYLKDNVKMVVSDNNEGLEALTHFKVIEEFKGIALVELELKTGRTHQIRAHLSSINHPVFGDSLYGAKSFMRNEFYNLKTQEQLLQSYYLSFIHPKTKEKMEFQLEEKDFSDDFIKVLNFLRRTNNV